MAERFPIDKLQLIETPFYYYDTELLRETLDTIKAEIRNYPGYQVHYAVKANANPRILQIIRESGLGADCVSGGEIKAAIQAGFPARSIVYAGVGKSDWEINLGLDLGIGCFNVESLPELEIISALAKGRGTTANIAFRINPNVGAHTHPNITTGYAENKFGIPMRDMEAMILHAAELPNINFVGLHFHKTFRDNAFHFSWLVGVIIDDESHEKQSQQNGHQQFGVFSEMVKHRGQRYAFFVKFMES